MNNKFLENAIPLKTYIESKGIYDKNALRFHCMFYHGIRFDAINRLESILKSGSILCGNKINFSYESFDGTKKYLYIDSSSDDNCNMGKYVSVMPYENSMEFDVFIRENLFFVINDTIEALETTHVSYDEYCLLRKKGLSDLYSYAFSEYLVKDEISLDDVLYIGIDSRYYSDNLDEIVSKVIELIKEYKINIPFIDINNNVVLFSLDKEHVKRLVK